MVQGQKEEEQGAEKKKGGGLREAMPEAARLVDELRATLGRQFVDDALRQGLALQREHARRQLEHGRARADAWLRAQRPTTATLRLAEAGRQVGELPVRLAGARA